MSMYDPVDDEGLEGEDLPPQELPPVTVEERARAMGWKPLPVDPDNPQRNEYRGDPRRWTDAETFIAHGEEELPILRDQNRRMSERLARTDSELADLRRTVTEQKDAVTAATNLARRANDQGYQRALTELKTRQREAVEQGDTVVYDQVEEELNALQATREEVTAPAPREEAPPPREEAPPPPAAPTASPPEIRAFVRDNPWFSDPARPDLKNAMIAAHNAVITASPHLSLADQLAEALDQMKADYPEIDDEDPMPPPRTPIRRRPASALAPTPPAPPRRTTGSPIDRIVDPEERREARAAFDSIRRQDAGMTEAEYMTIYDDPRADVVELRNSRKK